MKKFLKKVFYRESPAAGAVFSTLLFWLGTWCLASLFLLFPEGIFTLESASELLLLGRWSFGNRTDFFLVAALVFLLYHLFVTGSFYYGRFRERRIPGGLTLAAFFIAALAVAAGFGGREWCLAVCYAAWFWAIPLFSMPKQWKWLIPAALAPLLFLLPLLAVWSTLDILTSCDSREPFFRNLPVSPFLGWAAVILGLLCMACRFKAYAEVAGKPLRALFGKGAAVIFGLFLLTYGVTLGMAYSARCRTERHLAELEKFFGRPVTAQGLKTLYFQDRRPDAAFWQKAAKLYEPGYRMRWLFETEAEFFPAEFAAFKKQFEKFAELRELEKMFSSPPPAYDRKFVPGFLFAGEMPDLSLLRDFCRFELWRTRFTLADRDVPGALAAVERMKFCRGHLARDPALISALVLCAVENFRLDALERLLSSGLLTEGQLREMRRELAACREEMKTIHARAVYGEAVFAMDMCHLFARGGRECNEKPVLVIPGAYAWRWMFPAYWYICTRNREVLADTYKGSGFSRLKFRFKRSFHNLIASFLLPSFETAGNRIDALSARYLAMETLIGVELEKRRTGKYPDVLKDPPRDIFGTPLCYRNGKVPLARLRWRAKGTDGEGEAVRGKQVMTDAVAVWSQGPPGEKYLKPGGLWFNSVRVLMLKP